MHYQCLIVDDELELAQMTCAYFQMFDISSAYVGSVSEYEAFMKENTIELLLLDVNLQKESGFLLCKKIREESDIPIIFISARQSDDDMLTALQIGGDDYIKKPYTLSILLAKVKVVLKRIGKNNTDVAGNESGNSTGNENGNNANTGNIKSYNGMTLDKGTLSVTVGEKRVELKAREFRLLECLFDNKNTIVTKERLFQEVWGDSFFSDGTLNVHIRKLREKIEKNPNEPEMITTIWGTGYLLKL